MSARILRCAQLHATLAEDVSDIVARLSKAQTEMLQCTWVLTQIMGITKSFLLAGGTLNFQDVTVEMKPVPGRNFSSLHPNDYILMVKFRDSVPTQSK
jgi:hypothetical protein